LKAYLLTTGTIFGLVAVFHVFHLVADWSTLPSRPWFGVGVGATAVVGGALSVWALRLLRAGKST
jgi:hypothetical protein